MAYDPGTTQRVKIDSNGSTDRHKVQELIWRAIDNLEEGLKETAGGQNKLWLEVGRLPETVEIRKWIHADRTAFRKDVERLEKFFWIAIAAIGIDIVTRLLGKA